MIDTTDTRILTILQENARTSHAEIGRRLGLAPSGILERIRKLEERGVIRGHAALVDPRALELGLLAFLFIRTEDPVGSDATAQELAARPEVLEVHHIAGEDCYLVKVRTRDTAALSLFLREIGALPGVRSTRTTVVLDTTKETPRLPVKE